MLLFAFTGAAAPLAMAASLNEGSPLTEGAAEPETTTPTTPTTSSTSTETSNTKSTSILVIAFVAAAVLLGGITFVIIRDVRRVAPATDAEMAEGSSARDPAVALRKRRAKAKAARRQRKRNR
jgi:heme-binding NEAT domain protein